MDSLNVSHIIKNNNPTDILGSNLSSIENAISTELKSISNNLLITFGTCVIISYLLAYFFNYKKSNDKLQELVLIAKDSCYHIHHWMWMTVLIGCVIIGKHMTNDYIFYGIIGLWLGSCLEDLLFDDWYVVKNNCHKKKLIKFLQHTTDVFGKGGGGK